MKDEEHGVKTVLKARALFLVNELVFGDEETGENADADVDVLVFRRPGKVQEIEKGREHRERIQRMPEAFPFRKTALLVDDEFIHQHDEALKCEG